MSIAVQGYCDPRFSAIETAFRENFDAGLELGASLAVTWRGRMVVDLWAGWADQAQTRPWTEDTLVRVYSSGKMAAILSTLMLIDRGLIELDRPVADYWPAFAQGGKAAVTVREALSHRGGVPGFDPPIGRDLYNDWTAATARLAAEPHWFGGRPTLFYHYATFGFLLGGMNQQVDGRSPRQLFRETVADRLSCDFHLGLSDRADQARVAEIRWPTEIEPPTDADVIRVVGSTPDPLESAAGPWSNLAAEDPGGNSFANGRAIAKLLSIFALNGTVDGETYLSRAIVDEAGKEQVLATCPYLGPASIGLGFGRYHPEHFPVGTPTGYGWGGIGGSVGFADPVVGISLGYAPNNFIFDPNATGPRQIGIMDALKDSIRTL